MVVSAFSRALRAGLHRGVDLLGLAQIDDRDLALPRGRDEPGGVMRRQPLLPFPWP